MLSMQAPAPSIVPLIVAKRRPPTYEQRVMYELARLRIAGTRDPAPRFAHLIRPRD